MTKANTTPIYPGVVRTAQARVSAANANRDGTGTLVTLATAGTDGSVVARVGGVRSGAAAAAETAQVARLWRVNGGTKTLIDEVLLGSLTPNTAAIGTRFQFNRTNIVLGSGEVLAVSQTVAENVDYEAELGDY
jgi:hypothetical protein